MWYTLNSNVLWNPMKLKPVLKSVRTLNYIACDVIIVL
jgi:hypothetical protein